MPDLREPGALRARRPRAVLHRAVVAERSRDGDHAAGERTVTSVCLALNVKDAEPHIARCITSALKFPGVDRALFIDTGCTDRTIDVIRETLGDQIPYELQEEMWEGHAHNRSILLERVRATGADYCLMLDADMEVLIEGDIP